MDPPRGPEMSRKRWIQFLVVVLALMTAGWQLRHPIMRVVRRLALPSVAAAPPGTIRFAIIGDFGSGSYMEQDVAQLIESWRPDFVTTVGDNDYAGGTGSLDRAVGRFYHGYIYPYHGKYGKGAATNRFFPIPGHRDWDHDALRPYLDYFTLPGNERYYDLVRGPVHLFMLDSDEREPDGATATSIQAQWLREGLARSTAPWNLVLAQHAPYTSHRVADTKRMRWPFKAWGADAVVSGFYHVYERLLVDGLPYFVDGVGGSSVSEFGEIDPHSRFRYAGDYGAMLVDATDTRIIFRFVNRRGRMVDADSLVKDRKETP
jgi:tartrate-resistant acid phosphatase type 5